MRAAVAARVPVIELNRRIGGNDPRIVPAIYRVLRRDRPDILHTHAWGTLVEGIVAGRLARVPAIVHGEHGTLQLRPRQVIVQRWGWRHADDLLSVSSRLAERMSRDVGIPADRIRVIRNGVNLARFAGLRTASAGTFSGSGGRRVVLGAAGRLIDVKDHATFIDAVHLLRDRGRPVAAIIAGDGPLRGQLEAHIARLRLQGSVRLLGHRGDLETVLRALDIFVQPSKSEGMSNTILEAMASGLPVVATRVGGADEMIVDGETGILVPPADSERLADALERLIGDAELRHTMGCAATRRASREFSLAHMIDGYQSFYCDVFERQTSRGDARTREELVG
jgi:glycosyltransferase involved in cell wall biosynthesis